MVDWWNNLQTQHKEKVSFVKYNHNQNVIFFLVDCGKKKTSSMCYYNNYEVNIRLVNKQQVINILKNNQIK